MSYAPPRPRVSTKQRAEIFASTNGHCYLCGGKIQVGEAWDADHPLARELGGTDDYRELRPAHKKCHVAKTATDVRTIAKSNRVRNKHLGFAARKSSWPQRPLGYGNHQHTATRPIVRVRDINED